MMEYMGVTASWVDWRIQCNGWTWAATVSGLSDSSQWELDAIYFIFWIGAVFDQPSSSDSQHLNMRHNYLSARIWLNCPSYLLPAGPSVSLQDQADQVGGPSGSLPPCSCGSDLRLTRMKNSPVEWNWAIIDPLLPRFSAAAVQRVFRIGSGPYKSRTLSSVLWIGIIKPADHIALGDKCQKYAFRMRFLRIVWIGKGQDE